MTKRTLDSLLIGKEPAKVDKTRKYTLSELDSQARNEAVKWINSTSKCGADEYRRNLVENEFLCQYLEKGRDPAGFKEVIGMVSAVIGGYGTRSEMEEYQDHEEDIKCIDLLNEPVIKNAVKRFYKGNEKQVKELVKESIGLIYSCAGEIEPKKLKRLAETVKPWLVYISPKDIVDSVEIPMMADLAYLVTDSLNIGHLQTPTPILEEFDKAIAAEPNETERQSFQRQRDRWANEDREIKQSHLECVGPVYRREVTEFVKQMRFMRDILGSEYRPENFKQIMGSEEYGDPETPKYFKQFFPGEKTK